ncbi:MAG: Xaa-Pro peptidase family protein [Pirellulales bacterium]|nr:Xaa-Pro peptidase family protein [Pirellulales bacterium]
MLTAEGCRQRRERLWAACPESLDALLIADPQHLVYLADYAPSPFVFRTTNSGALLVLTRQGPSILIADNFMKAVADAAHVDERVLPIWYRGVETAPIRRGRLIEAVAERLGQLPGTHFGYEPGHVPAGVVERLRDERGEISLFDIAPILHRLKRSKDADELAMIRRSLRAAEAGYAAALAEARPGMSELDLFLLVQNAVLRADGEQLQLYGDFVSGPRTAAVGGLPSARVIEPGDLVLIDFSAVVHGYRGDLANTFACGAGPTPRQREMYEAILEALAAAETVLAAGRPARDVDRTVRSSFAARGLAERFTSHSGHGIGLGHPDPPYFVPESADVLQVGDVVAVEPGLYFPGEFGMRYEHNYLITESGYERLSQHALQIDQPA